MGKKSQEHPYIPAMNGSGFYATHGSKVLKDYSVESSKRK